MHLTVCRSVHCKHKGGTDLSHLGLLFPGFGQEAQKGDQEPFLLWASLESSQERLEQHTQSPGAGGWAPWLLLAISQYQIPVVSCIVTHLSYHYLLLGMCYEQRSDLLSVHSHHFLKRLHCFVETGGHDRMGGTGIL